MPRRAPIEPDTWKWFWSTNEEEYSELGVGTRAWALREAQAANVEITDGFYLVEAKQNPPRLARHARVSDLWERMDESASEDYGGPDGESLLEHLPAQAIQEFESMVEAAIDQWQEKYKGQIIAWQFSEMRNAEYVPGLPSWVEPISNVFWQRLPRKTSRRAEQLMFDTIRFCVRSRTSISSTCREWWQRSVRFLRTRIIGAISGRR